MMDSKPMMPMNHEPQTDALKTLMGRATKTKVSTAVRSAYAGYQSDKQSMAKKLADARQEGYQRGLLEVIAAEQILAIQGEQPDQLDQIMGGPQVAPTLG